MPKYDLRCNDCNAEFNIRASIAEKSEKRIKCTDCGSVELSTVFKSPPALLKSKCPNSSGCASSGCRYAS